MSDNNESKKKNNNERKVSDDYERIADLRKQLEDLMKFQQSANRDLSADEWKEDIIKANGKYLVFKLPRLRIEPEDATYISSSIYELTDIGVMNAEIKVRPHERCIDILLLILLPISTAVGGTLTSEYSKRALDYLIKKIRRRLKKRYDDAMNGIG